MGWITEANKLGRYDRTYMGFRIYVTKEGTITTRHEQREDGIYQITDFTKTEYIAVNKQGCEVVAGGLEAIGLKIDIEVMRMYYDKKESQKRMK